MLHIQLAAAHHLQTWQSCHYIRRQVKQLRHRIQHEPRHRGRCLAPLHHILHLVLHTGQREGQIIQFHGEGLARPPIGIQRIQCLARRERKTQQHTRPVNELPGRNILSPANGLRLYVAAIRGHVEQLRRTAGQVPGQKRLIQQVKSAGRPGRRR